MRGNGLPGVRDHSDAIWRRMDQMNKFVTLLSHWAEVQTDAAAPLRADHPPDVRQGCAVGCDSRGFADGQR